MFEEIMFGLWLALGAYVTWYVFKAKEYQPLALDDLALIWKLHKRQTGCKSSYIHDLLVRNDEVVGFRCECGHEFFQKRLITQRTKVSAPSGTLVSLQNVSGTIENPGLSYQNIRKI